MLESASTCACACLEPDLYGADHKKYRLLTLCRPLALQVLEKVTEIFQPQMGGQK